MSVTLNRLKELENRGNPPLKARLAYLLINELLENLTKEERDLVKKQFLEELGRMRRFVLKVTCPYCKGRISRRFKAALRSGERASDEDELFSNTQKEIEKLWVDYKQKLRPHHSTFSEESDSDSELG